VRLNVQQIWDLTTARCRFGKYLRVEVNGSIPPVAEVLRDFPTRKTMTEQGALTQGLSVRLVLDRGTARGELDLGDDGKFFPTDAAIARWQEGSHGKARVVYEL